MRKIKYLIFLVAVCAAVTGCMKCGVTVTISPAEAVSAGAQWCVNNGGWMDSGATVSGLLAGQHTISFKNVSGWIAPADQQITVNANQTASITAIYVAQSTGTGSVQVTITPAVAVSAGAQWRLDNGAWMNSGAIASGIAAGKHAVSFKAVYQWVKADDQIISVAADTPTAASATYTPLGTEFTVLAYNDLGMHCLNSDFSEFMVLPPYNNLYVQIIQRGGEEPRIVSSGLTVNYYIPSNTTSADKTNFWSYASAFFNPAPVPDAGLTGNGLSGTMVQSGRNDWIATGIPITPINDAGQLDSYTMATVIVMQNGVEVGRTHAVVPVSWEMRCDLCHIAGNGGTVESAILTSHDNLHGTTLMHERPLSCGRCHAQPELGMTGNPALPTLSSAMHTAHAPRMQQANLAVPCYACHPGIMTQCQRDVHFSRGLTCTNCHGEMTAVGNPVRRPWVDEPRCGTCHTRVGFEFEQPDTLFRDSKGHMGVHCEACHGSPHAITPTINVRDNEQAITYQGTAGTINTCAVCHTSPPDESFPHRLSED